jgi:predicted DNA-binding ribbon-helix-helix protein
VRSQVVKHSIIIAKQQTSISLENDFWDGLKEIARSYNMTVAELTTMIDSQRRHGNLSSVIRVFVLRYYRDQLAELKDGAVKRKKLAGAGNI